MIHKSYPLPPRERILTAEKMIQQQHPELVSAIRSSSVDELRMLARHLNQSPTPHIEDGRAYLILARAAFIGLATALVAICVLAVSLHRVRHTTEGQMATINKYNSEKATLSAQVDNIRNDLKITEATSKTNMNDLSSQRTELMVKVRSLLEANNDLREKQKETTNALSAEARERGELTQVNEQLQSRLTTFEHNYSTLLADKTAKEDTIVKMRQQMEATSAELRAADEKLRAAISRTEALSKANVELRASAELNDQISKARAQTMLEPNGDSYCVAGNSAVVGISAIAGCSAIVGNSASWTNLSASADRLREPTFISGAVSGQWQTYLDWSLHNHTSDPGMTTCVDQYLATEPACITEGGRACLMQRAIDSAKHGNFDYALRLSLITQCHNGNAQTAISAAGKQAVGEYLRNK